MRYINTFFFCWKRYLNLNCLVYIKSHCEWFLCQNFVNVANPPWNWIYKWLRKLFCVQQKFFFLSLILFIRPDTIDMKFYLIALRRWPFSCYFPCSEMNIYIEFSFSSFLFIFFVFLLYLLEIQYKQPIASDMKLCAYQFTT